MEHAFGSTNGFTLGIEEELLLVDPEQLRLSPVAAEVLARAESPEGTLVHEAYAAELENRTDICADVQEAIRALTRGRVAARDAGATLLAAGVHPAGELGDAALVDAERYRRVADSMRGLLQRTPECALHVHVGMPDPDSAIRAFNGLRRHLPLLAALSAASPFWFGRDSGFASARAALVRAYPGRGVPRAFRDFAEYEQAVAEATAAGGLEDYTMLWWDVRPHPRFGTVEVREMDAQVSLEDVGALAALVQALALEATEEAQGPEPTAEALGWSSFHATRDGLGASIMHEGTLRAAPEVARATLERLRPRARELGAEAALDGVERIVQEGGCAARQRAVHAADGMEGLLRWLASRTG